MRSSCAGHFCGAEKWNAAFAQDTKKNSPIKGLVGSTDQHTMSVPCIVGAKTHTSTLTLYLT